MKPKFRAGDSVRIKDMAWREELRGRWGFLVSNGVVMNGSYVYWIFVPEYPFNTNATEPNIKDLSWCLMEYVLETLE